MIMSSPRTEPWGIPFHMLRELEVMPSPALTGIGLTNNLPTDSCSDSPILMMH